MERLAKRHRNGRVALVLASSLVLAACAEDIGSNPAEDVDTDADTSASMAMGSLPAEPPEDGAAVDATSNENWVHFDLESEAIVYPEVPEDSDSWDLAFRRFHVALNGGESGGGAVEALVLVDQDYDELQSVPEGEFVTDAPDGDDDNEDVDYVISAGEEPWYAYDVGTHALSPMPIVYVVRTHEGNYFKLQFVGYYNSAGTSGHMQFRFAQLDP